MIATFFPGFQSFWFICSKDASFYEFCVAISAKIWQPSIYFTLATISSTLQPIWWLFHLLKWQFSLPFSIPQGKKRHPFQAEPPCVAHHRENPGWRSHFPIHFLLLFPASSLPLSPLNWMIRERARTGLQLTWFLKMMIYLMASAFNTGWSSTEQEKLSTNK